VRFDAAAADAAAAAAAADPAQLDFTPTYLDLTGATVDSLRLSGTLRSKQPPFIVTEGLRLQSLDCKELTVVTPAGGASWLSLNDCLGYVLWLLLVGGAFALVAEHRSPLGWWVAGYVGLTLLLMLLDWLVRRRKDLNDAGLTVLLVPLDWLVRRRKDLAHAARMLLFSLRDVLRRHPRLHRLVGRTGAVRFALRTLFARRRLPTLDHLDETYPFSRGYYILVERRNREAGDDATADEVFLLRRRRERKGPREPADLPPRMRAAGLIEDWAAAGFATRVWLWFLDFLMGYGVRPGRLVHLFVLLGLLNTAVFLSDESVERPVAFVQHREDSPQWGATNREPSGGDDPKKRMPKNPWPSDGGMPDEVDGDRWGTGHAAFMALRVQVPVLTLVTENDWSPATRPMRVGGREWLSYADYASIMMVVNLVLIPLIVAGLTGHLKRNT